MTATDLDAVEASTLEMRARGSLLALYLELPKRVAEDHGKMVIDAFNAKNTELRAARERSSVLEVAAANVALCFNDWPKHNSPYAHNERLRALKSLIDAAAARAAQEG